MNISQSEALTVVHDMSREHMDIVLAKSDYKAHGYAHSKRKRAIPGTKIGLWFKAYASSGRHGRGGSAEVMVTVIGHKRLKFSTDKIELFVVENTLLKGDDL
jgi:hypothetical protein